MGLRPPPVPLVPLGLGASLLAVPLLSGEAAGFWGPLAATVLAIGLVARALARRLRGLPLRPRELLLSLLAPALVAGAAGVAGAAKVVAVASLAGLPLLGLAILLEGAEARPRWRGQVRSLLALALALALGLLWAHFWAVDLGRSRARLALAPAQALATAAAALGLFWPGARRASPLRMALGGGALGLGLAYALLAARAESVGCVGVSSAYQNTLGFTALLLYGVGPLAADAR